MYIYHEGEVDLEQQAPLLRWFIPRVPQVRPPCPLRHLLDRDRAGAGTAALDGPVVLGKNRGLAGIRHRDTRNYQSTRVMG